MSCQQKLDVGGSAAEWLQLQKEKAREKSAVQRRAAEQHYNQRRATSGAEVAKPVDSKGVTDNLDEEVEDILEGYEQEMLKIPEMAATGNVMSSPEKGEHEASPNKRDRISKCISLNIESFAANPATPATPTTPCVAEKLGDTFWTPHREETPKMQTPKIQTPVDKTHLTRWRNSGLAAGGLDMRWAGNR